MTAAHRTSPNPAGSTIATVAGRVLPPIEGALWVEIDSERFPARRAVGCLVEPQAGDRVLLAIDAESVYVLSVLDRPDDSAVRVSAQGDLTLEVAHGRFGVIAQEGIDLLTGEDVKVAARKLDVTASVGELLIRSLRFVGERAGIQLDATTFVSRLMDAVHERWALTTERSLKVVAETDVVRADSADYHTTNTLRMHAKNAVVTATDLVKMDGSQIHLG